MILVHGPDETLVSEVVGHLTDSGQAAEPLLPQADVFEAVVQTHAKVIVALLPPHVREHDERAREAIQLLVRASNAPRPPVVVLVSPLPSDGETVRALKRSGAAYVLIPCTQTVDRTLLRSLRDQTVWLTRALLDAPAPLATRSSLLAAIAQAVRDDMAVGVELTPTPERWRDLLGRAGARTRVAPRWLVQLAAACKQRALYVDRDGKLVVRLAPPVGTRTGRLRLGSGRIAGQT